MMSAIDRGLAADGVLPGGLRLPRKARAIYIKAKMQSESMRRTGLLVTYAHAVSEENAALGEIVTAPTCGSCGVLSDGAHVVSFDTVVKTMLETGHDLPRLYRETSVGGLSRFVRR